MNKEKFRFIRYQEFDAFMNMALDEAICESVSKGESLPTIRLYSWKPCAISIGYFQGYSIEVNEEECKKQGIDIVRRRTGGGAVYHDCEGEITYSIIAPENYFSKNIIESYKEICNILIDALKNLGIDAQFSPINDIITNSKKISGNAQTRRGGILLQHGTILYKVDVDKMFSLLNVSKEKIADKLITSVKKRVTSICDEITVSKDSVKEEIENAFSKKYDLKIDEYSSEELENAKEISISRYSSDDWNKMR